jgi:phenylalanyl-tRNA synthetase beta chain
MHFTYNWLKEFINVQIPAQELAKKLTMAGLEVTSLDKKDNDFVFEIEVTSNRPDCLSVVGIAREVAAITDSKLKLSQATGHRPQAKSLQPAACSLQQISIKIENKKDCPLYTAKIIRDIKVGPSPDWLRKRLELVGCRSVNNIVDITNYVQFTWGEPLHAFDLDKLAEGVIIVRRAKNGEKITTIDGEGKILNPDILVIADKQKPVAIAGVMGGKDTEVTERAKNILLEAAVFNPIIVRRTRQALGLMSESAYRFERGVDSEAVGSASLRAVELMQEYAKGRRVLAKSSGQAKTKKKSINLEVSTVNKILGINIAGAKIKKILGSLGFKTKTRGKNNFTVTVPSHRPDVNSEIDLIEEVARLFGFESIPKTLPLVRPQLSIVPTETLVSLIKNILVGLGLNEVITYSLIDKELLTHLGMQGCIDAIEILNPLSKEQEILRPKLIPSLTRCVAYNLNQKQDGVDIFEVAKTFTGALTSPKEELSLGIALCGTKSYLFEQGLVKDEASLLHLKGILEVLFERLGIKEHNLTRENTGGLAIFVNQEKIGLMLRLQKDTLDKLDIKNQEVFLLELSLDRLFSYAELKKKFTPLPKYPGVARDISFVLKEDISVKDILEAMKEKGQPLLDNIEIVDYYKGKQIPLGFRGLTISCLYRSKEKTLTEIEINPLHTLLCSILTEQFGAKIR